MKDLWAIVKLMRTTECEFARIKGRHKKSGEDLLLVVARGKENIEQLEEILDKISDEVR